MSDAPTQVKISEGKKRRVPASCIAGSSYRSWCLPLVRKVDVPEPCCQAENDTHWNVAIIEVMRSQIRRDRHQVLRPLSNAGTDPEGHRDGFRLSDDAIKHIITTYG